jgi:hypothetical protein
MAASLAHDVFSIVLRWESQVLVLNKPRLGVVPRLRRVVFLPDMGRLVPGLIFSRSISSLVSTPGHVFAITTDGSFAPHPVIRMVNRHPTLETIARLWGYSCTLLCAAFRILSVNWPRRYRTPSPVTGALGRLYSAGLESLLYAYSPNEATSYTVALPRRNVGSSSNHDISFPPCSLVPVTPLFFVLCPLPRSDSTQCLTI